MTKKKFIIILSICSAILIASISLFIVYSLYGINVFQFKFNRLVDGQTIYINNNKEEFDFSKIVEPSIKIYTYDEEQKEIPSKRTISLQEGDNKFIIFSNSKSKIINIHRNRLFHIVTNINKFGKVAKLKSDIYEENQIIKETDLIWYLNNSQLYVKISCEPTKIVRDFQYIELKIEEIKDTVFYISSSNGVWTKENNLKDPETIRKFSIWKINRDTNNILSCWSDIYSNEYFLKDNWLPIRDGKIAEKIILQKKIDGKIINKTIFIFNKDKKGYNCATEDLSEIIGKTLIAIY